MIAREWKNIMRSWPQEVHERKSPEIIHGKNHVKTWLRYRSSSQNNTYIHIYIYTLVVSAQVLGDSILQEVGLQRHSSVNQTEATEFKSYNEPWCKRRARDCFFIIIGFNALMIFVYLVYIIYVRTLLGHRFIFSRKTFRRRVLQKIAPCVGLSFFRARVWSSYF